MRTSNGWLPFVAASAACFMVGCAAGEDPGSHADDGYELLAPTLGSITPDQISLGDDIKVFGEDFIPKEEGSLALFLDGEYVDSDGDRHPFSGEVLLKVENSSVASFPFEEIFFHPKRDELGTWRGSAMLVNRRPERDDSASDDELWSDELDVSLRVLPSIMIERLRSADDTSCAMVTEGTNSSHNLELGFKAIGLGQASQRDPWEVRVSFLSPEVTAYFVTPDLFDDGVPVWPLRDLEFDQSLASLASEGNHRISFAMDSGSSVVLNPQASPRQVEINPPVTIGQNVFNEVYLGKLATGEVPFGGQSKVNFLVEMSTEDGRELRRVVTFDNYSEVEIGIWSGRERMAERYEPHSVSGCVYGGLIGAEYSYTEGESMSRSRAVSFRQDASASQSLGFSAGNINIIQANGSQSWSQSFGIDINETISSEVHKSQNISIHLLPSFAAKSYRQLERWERAIDVVYHNACGVSGVVGEAVLTDWKFAFDPSQAESCPPPTNLSPAQTFED